MSRLPINGPCMSSVSLLIPPSARQSVWHGGGGEGEDGVWPEEWMTTVDVSLCHSLVRQHIESSPRTRNSTGPPPSICLDSSLSGSMEGGGFLGRAHPGFAETAQRLHSPAARLGEPGWWRLRAFLRKFAVADLPGKLPSLHRAGSPRVARPRISSKANNWASWIAWRARYVTSGRSAAGFGCVAH